LSFAQFERELIAERTRDKIAAARRKGKWVGGMPLLGYDIDSQGSKLRVNDAEAARVRAIFALYLEYQALGPVVRELDRRRWRTKRWRTRKGHFRGGRAFTRNTLRQLLDKVTYVGHLRYRQEVHPGEHAAIVDHSSRGSDDASFGHWHKFDPRRTAHVAREGRCHGDRQHSGHRLRGRGRVGHGSSCLRGWRTNGSFPGQRLGGMAQG
jgi:hypothetical protein